MLIYNIANIIGSPIAISPSKASILYSHFVKQIEDGKKVVYSFEGIGDFSSAFCNASIGKVYMFFGKKADLISFTDIKDEDGIWALKLDRSKQLGLEDNYRRNNQEALEEIIS